MELNLLKDELGSAKKRKRVGRGIGSGKGKTCGSGHKGQKSRSGGYHKVGFEGGQMPIQRRLPKVGFSSRIGRVTEELRLNELAGLGVDVIDVDALKAARLVNKNVQRVKVILSGKLEEAVTVKGLMLTKGARSAIEAAGGKIEE